MPVLRTQSVIEKCNMASPEPTYATATRPEQSNTAETQENDLKYYIMKMLKIPKRI